MGWWVLWRQGATCSAEGLTGRNIKLWWDKIWVTQMSLQNHNRITLRSVWMAIKSWRYHHHNLKDFSSHKTGYSISCLTIHFIFKTDKTKLNFLLWQLWNPANRDTNVWIEWGLSRETGCCLINLFIPINLKLSDLQLRLTSPRPHYESFSSNLPITRHQKPISTILYTISSHQDAVFC